MAEATIIDGVSLAGTVKDDLIDRIAEIDGQVRLDAVLVGEDQGAVLYADNQLGHVKNWDCLRIASAAIDSDACTGRGIDHQAQRRL